MALPNILDGSIDDVDDSPVEISSKAILEMDNNKKIEEEEMTVFAQIQEHKKSLVLEKASSKVRRLKRKKISKGEYKVEIKKSEFNVMTLENNLKKFLEPEKNYKTELLAARTNSRRSTDEKKCLQRQKWINRR